MTMDLTPVELWALRERCAPFVAAVFIRATGEISTCPSWTRLHECPRSWTRPQAEDVARDLAADGIEAWVIVYGVPWLHANAQKPAQGA